MTVMTYADDEAKREAERLKDYNFYRKLLGRRPPRMFWPRWMQRREPPPTEIPPYRETMEQFRIPQPRPLQPITLEQAAQQRAVDARIAGQWRYIDQPIARWLAEHPKAKGVFPPHMLLVAYSPGPKWEWTWMEEFARYIYASHSSEKVKRINTMLDAYERTWFQSYESIPQQILHTPRDVARAWPYIWRQIGEFLFGGGGRAGRFGPHPLEPRGTGATETLRKMPRLQEFFRWLSAGKPPHRYRGWMTATGRAAAAKAGAAEANAAAQLQRLPTPGIFSPRVRELILRLPTVERNQIQQLEEMAENIARWGGRALVALMFLQALAVLFQNLIAAAESGETFIEKVLTTIFGEFGAAQVADLWLGLRGLRHATLNIILADVELEKLYNSVKIYVNRVLAADMPYSEPPRPGYRWEFATFGEEAPAMTTRGYEYHRAWHWPEGNWWAYDMRGGEELTVRLELPTRDFRQAQQFAVSVYAPDWVQSTDPPVAFRYLPANPTESDINRCAERIKFHINPLHPEPLWQNIDLSR